MDWIASNRESLCYFGPEGFLAGVSLLILLLGAFGVRSRSLIVGIGFLALGLYIVLSGRLLLEPPQNSLFSGVIAGDRFAVFFKMFSGIVTFATLALVTRARELKGYSPVELVGFLLALTIGMSMMAAATDLLMMYLALEMVSVLSYIMVGYKKQSRLSSEAGLKYILYGSLASGVMIFGLSYLFGLVGSTDLRDIAVYFREIEGISLAPVTFFALLATMTGLGFKIAAFPTQMWCPDVYEGAATPVTAFLSVGPKAAGFAMTIRFFFYAFGLGDGRGVEIFQFINWGLVFAILAAITMTIGNLAAIPQRNMKRLMAYSSIGHAGYLLMGLATLSSRGVEAILFYLVVYLIMNMAAFLVIIAVADRLDTEEIDGYRGLGWRSPLLSATLAIALFSLTGLPPLAGFIGKYLLFAAVIEQGLYWLAIVAVINSVISLFYYARVIKTMYLEQPLDEAPMPSAFFYRAFAFVLAVPMIVLGVYWEPLSIFVSKSVQGLF